MIICYDLRCKYCNDKCKCTNKNVELAAHGINTVNQGFRHFLECKSFELHPWYDNAMELVKKIREMEREEKNEPK